MSQAGGFSIGYMYDGFNPATMQAHINNGDDLTTVVDRLAEAIDQQNNLISSLVDRITELEGDMESFSSRIGEEELGIAA